MNLSDEIKSYRDPLFASIGEGHKSSQVLSQPNGGGTKIWPFLALFGVGMAALGFLLWQAQQQIDDLGTRLGESQAQLGDVSEDLRVSDEKIEGLQKEMEQSGSKISTHGQKLEQYQGKLNQHRGLYFDLKSEQQQQSRELESVAMKKVDRSQLEELQGQTDGIKNEVALVNSSLADVREASSANRATIGRAEEKISGLDQGLNDTKSYLSRVAESLKKDRYDFELHEKAGYVKVREVSLRLKDVDLKRQRYDLDLVVNGRWIRKRHQNAQEPVSFYVKGVEKTYEVVITKIDKKQVAGYLSVPKEVPAA